MTIKALEQRVATMEAELAELKRKVEGTSLTRDWRKTIGMFTDDEGMKEMFRDAVNLRAKEREKVRRKPRKAAG